jgi:hypothetical protein
VSWAHFTRAWAGGERAPDGTSNDFGTFSSRPATTRRRSRRRKVCRQPAPAPSARISSSACRRSGARASLDGNLFADSHKVTRTPRWAMHAGLAFQWGPVQLAVSRVARSREFSEQGRRHAFGQVFIGIPALRW